MASIIRNVRDIEETDREAIEHLVGRKLHEHQQIIIHVTDAVAPAPQKTGEGGGRLPDWCNIYEGLADAEVDDIETSILRTPGGRTFDADDLYSSPGLNAFKNFRPL